MNIFRKGNLPRLGVDSHQYLSTMLSQINKILNSEQLEAVLKTLFCDRPVKILRIIPATGRSQVSWIHLENTVSGQRLATFISFQDLIASFWEWLAVLLRSCT